MFCPNCGSNIENNLKFCPNCGASLTQQTASQGAPNNGNYRQNGYQRSERVYGEPVMGGGGTNRNIALCIIFSIITCGIYGLYWLYCLNDEINSLSGDVNAAPGGLVILFTIITCGIYGWFWLYKMGERTDRIKQNMGLPPSSSGILYLILGIFGLAIIAYAIMQDTINKTVA